MLAVLLLMPVALAAAQEPRPCTSPQQFEGRAITIDHSKNFFRHSKYSYDESQQRIREEELVTIGATREFTEYLFFFELKKEYRINMRTRNCTSHALNDPFRPAGIPRDSHYEGQFTIGPVNLPKEHVSAIEFAGKTPDGGLYRGSVSSPDCVPIDNEFYSNKTGLVQRFFFDITTGIADPTVFDIPSNCPQ